MRHVWRYVWDDATRVDDYDATATITSDSDAPVVARVSGEIVELLVEEGDAVEEGQVLARLDGERLRLEMLAAKASLDQARAEYRRNTDLHERGLISAAAFDNLKYDLQALEASYELKKLNYGYASIRTPIAGVVASRSSIMATPRFVRRLQVSWHRATSNPAST